MKIKRNLTPKKKKESFFDIEEEYFDKIIKNINDPLSFNITTESTKVTQFNNN